MKTIIVPLDFTDESLTGLKMSFLRARKTIDYAQSVDADLISIITEQEGSASNLLLGNFAHKMINKAFIPVLSFPNYWLRIIAEDIWTLGAFNP